jgi:hypothetical protein
MILNGSGVLDSVLAGSQLSEIREVTLLNLEDLLHGKSRSNAGRIPLGRRGGKQGEIDGL